MFTKKSRFRASKGGEGSSSSHKSSSHRRRGSSESLGSITDLNATESDEDSSGDHSATTSNAIIIELQRPRSPPRTLSTASRTSSTASNHRRLMAFHLDGNAQYNIHNDQPTISKQVTIAETNRLAIFDANATVSEFQGSTTSQRMVQCPNDNEMKPGSLARWRSRLLARKRSSHSSSQRAQTENSSGLSTRYVSKPLFQVVVNPFEHRREVFLGRDMSHIADALKIDYNTQAMLAFYDAKSLEDFSLMAQSDVQDLVAKAQSMGRTIPPLQVRKIEVLREWIQSISRPRDDSKVSPWRSRRTASHLGKARRLIPRDWKERFHKDLPRLLEKLQAQSSAVSTFSIQSFTPNWRRITMCGFVERGCVE